jgi:hypothetical protein
MATFFLGQLVRIRYMRVAYWNTLAGRPARVVGVGPYPPVGGYSMAGDYRVQVIGDDGDPAQVLADQLEPVLPEGHRAGDYSLSDLLDRCRAGEGVPA